MSSPQNPLIPLLEDLPSPRAQLSEYLLAHVASRPDDEAAIEGDRRVTYAELGEQVARLAAVLTSLGVQRGDRVAVLAPPSIDFWTSFLATTALGAVWLGLNPKHTRAELRYVLDDAKPRVLLARDRIAGRDFIEDLREFAAATNPRLVLFAPRADAPDLQHLQELLPTVTNGTLQVPPATETSDPALLVYTSGSTGAPKGALLSHRALIRGALVRTQIWSVAPWRALNNLPINHIGCVGDIACTTFIAGGCQIFMEKFDAAATLRVLEEERVSFWYQIPTMFQLCLDQQAAATTRWSHLDLAVWSGGRAPSELIDRLERVAARLAVDYSMTESVGSISLTPGTRDRAVLTDTVGWPDPGRNLRIVRPGTVEPCARGDVGEIQLEDPWRFSGYASATAPADTFASDGWFRTGDLARYGENGTLILVGRSREMFKSGGYNVYPKEIEQTIETHADVVAAAVVPAPDALFGEVGVAFVLPRTANLPIADLQAHCRHSLANYKVPKRFVLVPAMPLLPTGKIDRVALRSRAQALSS